MNKDLEVLDNNDVIAVFENSQNLFDSGNTVKIRQLLEEYRITIHRSKTTVSSSAEIFDDSIECEVLRHDSEHKGWRKGKIKFVVQFEPEKTEPNSNSNSLDDIR